MFNSDLQRLFVPAACGLASILILLLQFIFSSESQGHNPQSLGENHQPWLTLSYQRLCISEGSIERCIWKLLRLAGCVALTGISIAGLVLGNDGQTALSTGGLVMNARNILWTTNSGAFDYNYYNLNWVEVTLCMFYVSTLLRQVCLC